MRELLGKIALWPKASTRLDYCPALQLPALRLPELSGAVQNLDCKSKLPAQTTVWLDTKVLLDGLLEREPFAADSAKVYDAWVKQSACPLVIRPKSGNRRPLAQTRICPSHPVKQCACPLAPTVDHPST